MISLSTLALPTPSQEIGSRLRRARERAGVSVALATKRAGCTRRELNDLERGRDPLGPDTLDILARLYSCPIEYLVTGTGPSALSELRADRAAAAPAPSC